MAKQILVKTPLTTNGTDPVFGEDGKLLYSESILSDNGTQTGAKAILEKRNQTLPQHLKLIITDVEEVPDHSKGSTNNTPGKAVTGKPAAQPATA